jgi:DNA-nicking Smr family endonuclease
MARRRLTRDEVDLWRMVADRTERLHPEKAATGRPVAKPLPKPKPAKPLPPRIAEFQIGQKAAPARICLDLVATPGDRLAAARVDMDQKAYRRLKRGKLKPEARIDLHGLTLDRANPALVRFILSAQASGKRLVLVITGKGRAPTGDGPIPERHGILKHHVPQWLASPPLSQAIIQVSTAHIRHGGSGAYYVYLRRIR